jgi:hypothetical protein
MTHPTQPAAADEGCGWQPIETAPRNGTEFIAAYGRQGFVKQLVRFNTVWGHWESKGVVTRGFETNATHWMPLPPPPATEPPAATAEGG